MEKKHDEISLKDLLNIFLPKLWIMVLVSLICGLVTGLYFSFFKDDTYTSSSIMYVYKSENSVTSSDITIAEDMVELYDLIITTDEVLNVVVSNLPEQYSNIGITASYLRSVINVSAIGSKGVFKISVTTTDPSLSYAIAEAAEKVVPAEIMNRIPNALQLTVIESPTMARYANNKNISRNVLITFMAGFVLSGVLVFVFSFFDVIIHDKKKIEDNFNIPILGVIPHYDVDMFKGA